MSPIPQVEAKPCSLPEDPRDNGPQDHEFVHGLFTNADDGLTYALAVHEPDHYFRTHSCKNSAYFWQGDQEEFRAKFTAVK